MIADQRRPHADVAHDQPPAHAVGARHRAQAHLLRVDHQAPRQTPGQLPVELAVGLQLALAAALTNEPAPPPAQRHTPTRHRQIAHHLVPPIVHTATPEPAVRAPQPPRRRLHDHLQARRRIHRHLQHTQPTQLQPHRHMIQTHRGPPGSAISQSPIPAGPRPHPRDPQLPLTPQIRAGPEFFSRSGRRTTSDDLCHVVQPDDVPAIGEVIYITHMFVSMSCG